MLLLAVRGRLSGEVCGEGWWWRGRFSGFFAGVGEGVGGSGWVLRVGFVAGFFCGVLGSSSSSFCGGVGVGGSACWCSGADGIWRVSE